MRPFIFGSMAAKKSSRTKRNRQRRPRRGRFTTIISALIAFALASAAFQPQLRDHPQFGYLFDALEGESIQFTQLLRTWISGPEQYSIPSAAAVDGYVQTQFADCPQFFPQQQAPIVPAAQGLRELCFGPFAILHSGETKTPVFVAQRLNRQMLANTQAIKRTDRFYEEGRLPSSHRAGLADYRRSGYSRGHMAPAGDMHSNEAMAQSFSLANIAPQNQQHNAGAWNRIENDTHKYVKRARGDVYVFTGPVYEADPPTIGEGKVAVPAYLYKVVYDPNTDRSWVHWHENRAETRARSPISYEEFVRRTGLHLLKPLQNQKTSE